MRPVATRPCSIELLKLGGHGMDGIEIVLDLGDLGLIGRLKRRSRPSEKSKSAEGSKTDQQPSSCNHARPSA